MQRTIVVKGTGKVSLKPDRIELDLRMRALDKEYRASMEKGALYLSDLRDKLKEAGFNTDDLKTTNFNVERYSEYDSKKREYRFVGYYTNHSLRLGFDFDTELLSKALDAVSNSVSDPETDIRFTVKDKESPKEELLRSAAADARKKAEILTEASGVKLGELVNINYDWGELNIYSRTVYEDRAFGGEPMLAKSVAMDVVPDDIDLSDTVSFMWEIV